MDPTQLSVMILAVCSILYCIRVMWKVTKSNPPGEYQEYETAETIAEHWFDMSRLATCIDCKCADTPIVTGWRDPVMPSRCKWCAEFENIVYHLKYNGTRRLQKQR